MEKLRLVRSAGLDSAELERAGVLGRCTPPEEDHESRLQVRPVALPRTPDVVAGGGLVRQLVEVAQVKRSHPDCEIEDLLEPGRFLVADPAAEDAAVEIGWRDDGARRDDAERRIIVADRHAVEFAALERQVGHQVQRRILAQDERGVARFAPDVIVAAAVGVSPRDHLDVDPPPAGRAVLLQDVRESRPHFIQELVHPGDVFRLRDSDTVGRIHAAPNGAGVHIEVLPIDIDLVLGDDLVNCILDPAERLGIPVVHQLPVPVLRVLLQNRSRIRHPFRLEPEQEFQTGPVDRVGDRQQVAGRMCGRIDPPVADVFPPVRTTVGIQFVLVRRAVPAGIDPVRIERQLVVDTVPQDVGHHRGRLVPAARRHGQDRRDDLSL